MTRIGNKNVRCGLTLIEVVLAIALSVALVAAVLAFQGRCSHMRSILLARMEVVSAQRATMDLLTGELRSAMAYPFMGLSMQGDAQEMLFPTACVPGPAVWAVRKLTDDAIPPEDDLHIVTYRLRHTEGPGGEDIVVGLERICQKVVQQVVVEGEENPTVETKLLTEHVKFLYVRYWDGAMWAESWKGDSLPIAVEISLGTEPLAAETAPADYPYEVQRRVVYIPLGQEEAGGDRAIIRGLGDGGGDE